jgi:DNA-binding response OmpR family regulator
VPGPEIRARTPYVICVGTSPDETAAVARALDGRAVVIVASDALAIRPLLDARPLDRIDRQIMRHGQLTIDQMLRQVTWADRIVDLSPREFDLLATLAGDTGRVWTFEEITVTVWKTRYLGDADMVFSAVKRLRRRLADALAELKIVSVRGIGFRLVVSEAG